MSEDETQQNNVSNYRGSSPYSHYSQRFGSHPAFSSQPQPRFQGTPDLNLGLAMRPSGLKPGAHGYYFGFDNLVSNRGGVSHVENVVISGYEGGLNIHSVSKSGHTEMAKLTMLRGGVYNAKILPWTITEPKETSGVPLIAVVIHGPMLNENDATGVEETSSNPPAADTNTKLPTSMEDSSLKDRQKQGRPVITHYQTTVEVYSLGNGKSVATLLSLPPTTPSTSTSNSHSHRRSPSGALTISSEGESIVVSSGITGELWIFRQSTIGVPGPVRFRCIGKLWTAIQQSPTQDLPATFDTDTEGSSNEAKSSRLRGRAPLFAIRGRWLAYSPSTSSHQVSLRALVDASGNPSGRIPGLNTYAPPQVPNVNCTVDTPQGDEFWKRLSRQATQEAIKRARWIGDQGSRAWSNYWSKPMNNAAGNWQPAYAEQAHDFPPTHGAALPYDNTQPDPELISIIDLERLGNGRQGSNVTSATLATFKLPLGCSYMSFSPSGLALFTASSKGDVQFIWDLMRIQHTKSSVLQPQATGHPQGIHVRQIAYFARFTVAGIVDIVWTLPHGQTIAMVTEKNTIHFLDVPQNAFTWPPPRHRAKGSLSSASVGTQGLSPSPVAMASNAVNAVRTFTQPFLARPRGLSGTVSTPGRNSTIAAGLTALAGQSGKALASGISKSFGAASDTIQHFRRAGDNKLHLPHSSAICSVGCIKWFGGHNKETFAVLLDGFVKLYTIKHVRSKSKPDVIRIHIGAAQTDIMLPSIPNQTTAPVIRQDLTQPDEYENGQRDPEASTVVLPRSAPTAYSAPSVGTQSSIPQAEIESNAPYQPFHTDPRIGLLIYSVPISTLPLPSLSALLASTDAAEQPLEQAKPCTEESWVFGQPISTVMLQVGNTQIDEDDLASSDSHRALPTAAIERVTSKIPDDVSEPIVSTTRRRKATTRNSHQAADDEEGFFEDDCDVIDFASNRV